MIATANYNQQKCLVTGGGGFIGSHLVDHLLAKGAEVLAIDDFSIGRKSNLETTLKTHKFKLIDESILTYDLKKLMTGVTHVYHLAALADIVPSIKNPQKYHNVNVNGTVRVLEAARIEGVKRFIYAASSSCYGIPEKYPTPENTPLKPMYPYALTKLLGEQYALHWCQVYGLPVVSLRFFNVYGPRARTSGTYGAVFGVFLAQKLHSKPFTVVGNGEQTRDFTYVSDVVDAISMAGNSEIQGEIFNVGSGNTYSVNRLVELLDGPTINIPKRPGEPDCTFADISKIRSLLSWEPKVSFEEGVNRILKIIDDWRDAPVWNAQGIEGATTEWFLHLSK